MNPVMDKKITPTTSDIDKFVELSEEELNAIPLDEMLVRLREMNQEMKEWRLRLKSEPLISREEFQKLFWRDLKGH